jgi:tetratricopeptide (TPR) repeat protein
MGSAPHRDTGHGSAPNARVVALQKSLLADPHNAGLRAELGVWLLLLRRAPEAAVQFREALKLVPQVRGEILPRLGEAELLAGNAAEAVKVFQELVQIQPDKASTWIQLAAALRECGHPLEAIACVRKALAMGGVERLAHLAMGTLYLGEKQPKQAAAHFKKVLELEQDDFAARSGLSHALLKLGKLQEALLPAEEAVAKEPQNPAAWYQLGTVRLLLRDDAGARDACSEAVRLNPTAHWAWGNLGGALLHLGDYARAQEACERSLALEPNAVEPHWNLAYLELLNGHWKRGWELHEWRFRLPDYPHRGLSTPRWNGEPLEGKRLLLVAEQGFGDTLQFIRYAPMVHERGAGKVIAEVPTKLLSLIESAPGVDAVSDLSSMTPPEHDVWVSLLSLPWVLGVYTPEESPRAPYFQPSPARVSSVLADFIQDWSSAEQGVRIGVAWAGSPTHKNDLHRSCPPEILLPLLDLPDTRWLSLQIGPSSDAGYAILAKGGKIEKVPTLNDFHETASVLSCLDLVIGVDTALVHLAGGIGKPVAVLLPFMPDWRWGRSGTKTGWYPSATLFRQARRGDWGAVIADLGRWIGERGWSR